MLCGMMSVKLEGQSLPPVGTYTLSVITVQTMVIHHLYQNDQFCGFSRSSAPSQVTRFGSVLGLGRKGSGEAEGLVFRGGSCGSRSASRSFKIVVVEESGAVAELAVVVVAREEEREREDIVRGLQGCR